MYGKTVRRRRALLLVLVVLSLILLTAYFGESSGGGLHSVQRGFMTVIAPIQDGANTVLKPVRSVVDWFGEVAKAKDERERLRREVARLRQKTIDAQAAVREAGQLRKLAHLERANSLASFRPVAANVVAQSHIAWYQTINIDKGSSDGIAVDDPVRNDEGLIGKVTQVAPNAAQVSLITDSAVEVSARLAGSGQPGMVQPKVGDPEELLMQYLPANTTVSRGETVVTSGTIVAGYESLFPPGIPIGTVTSVNEESAYVSVNVRPAVQLGNLEVVQVLTQVQGSSLAKVSSSLAKLPLNQGVQSGAGGAPPGAEVAQVEGKGG